MKINKLIILISFFLFIPRVNAYVCKYDSYQDKISNESGGYQINGCGVVEITFNDSTGQVDSNSIKYFNKPDPTAPKNYFETFYFNIPNDRYIYDIGECPTLDIGLDRLGSNYCSFFASNDTSTQSTNLKQNVHYLYYGIKGYKDNEQIPVQDDGVDEKYKEEVYAVFGSVGHDYGNAGSCIIGELRYVFISSVNATVVGCVGKNEENAPFPACGGNGIRMLEKGERIEPSQKTGYIIGVCENPSVIPEYQKAYTCVYANTPCGRFDVQRDGYGKLSVKMDKSYQYTSDYFKNDGKCPDLYAKYENRSCKIMSFYSNSGYTKVQGMSQDAYYASIQDKTEQTYEPDYRNLCSTDAGVQKIVRFTGILILLCRFIAPIIIIVLGMIDLFKSVTSSDDKAISKAGKALIRRIIAGFAVFIAPSLIKFAITGANKIINKNETSVVNACTKCVFEPFKCNK